MKSRKMPSDKTNAEEVLKFSLWRRLRYRVEWLALVAMRAVARNMPLGLLRFSADTIGTLGAWCDWRGASTAKENLRVVFGATYSPRQRAKLVAQSYRHFARTFFELFWNQNLSPDLSAKYCKFVFEDEAATIEASKRGGIFITPHYGNFEWLAVAWSHRGFPLTIIAQNFKNPLITPMFAGDRSYSGNTIISQQGALLKMLRTLKRGGQIALLPDLTTSPKNSAAIIRAFGRKVSVTNLPAALGVKTACPVVPGISIPQQDGTYLCYVGKPISFTPATSMTDAAQACWDVFEPFILQNPAPWLWMYKHWRFLPADADPTNYPAYANRSPAFDKLEREMQI